MFATRLEARHRAAAWLISLCLVGCTLGDDDDDVDCHGECVVPNELPPPVTAPPETGAVTGGAPATPSTFRGGSAGFGGLDGGGFGSGGRLFATGGSDGLGTGGALFNTGGALFRTGGTTSFGLGGSAAFGP